MGTVRPSSRRPTRIRRVLRTLDLTGVDGAYRSLLPRGEFDVEAALDRVRPIVDDVAARGAEALTEYSHRFDGVVPPSLRVPPEALSAAAERLDPELEKAFREAIRRRREVASTLEVDADPVAATLADGARVGLRNVPVEALASSAWPIGETDIDHTGRETHREIARMRRFMGMGTRKVPHASRIVGSGKSAIAKGHACPETALAMTDNRDNMET